MDKWTPERIAEVATSRVDQVVMEALCFSLNLSELESIRRLVKQIVADAIEDEKNEAA